MTRPDDPLTVHRYYVAGTHQDVQSSFGIPAPSLVEAQAIARRRHADGYRWLHIYDSQTGLRCRWGIKYGFGPWYKESNSAPGTGPLIGSV